MTVFDWGLIRFGVVFKSSSFSTCLTPSTPIPQLQDRESMVTLLVGARYGVSQVVNHKLSITTTLTEFTSITRVELLPESDKVSLVKIYLQDIKVRPRRRHSHILETRCRLQHKNRHSCTLGSLVFFHC